MEKLKHKRMKSPTKEQTKERKKRTWDEYYGEHKVDANWMDAFRERTREARRKVKVEVLTHYGNGDLACVRCGFDDVRALSIDHVNGGGLAHVRQIKKKSGVPFYYWLKAQGYPLGYQTFCFNCQNIKKVENKEYYNVLNIKPAQPLVPLLTQGNQGGVQNVG